MDLHNEYFQYILMPVLLYLYLNKMLIAALAEVQDLSTFPTSANNIQSMVLMADPHQFLPRLF